MLKSFCIKTNNNRIIDYLLNHFEKVELDKLYVSKLEFKLYNNFIIHYKGKNLNSFYEIFSNLLSSAIIISCIEYFSNNKSAILDGFVNFRLNNYIKILDYIVDMAVNKFVIDREYTEFIDLLKCYINSKDCGTTAVHLIYQNQESTLLDEFKKIIDLDDSILNSKYLSDITFSSNDYTLNTLLTLLPGKIYVHLIDGIQDEFINTLKLVFDNRIYICNDCNICKVYRLESPHILDKL